MTPDPQTLALRRAALKLLAKRQAYTDELAREVGCSPGTMAIVMDEILADQLVVALDDMGFRLTEKGKRELALHDPAFFAEHFTEPGAIENHVVDRRAVGALWDF